MKKCPFCKKETAKVVWDTWNDGKYYACVECECGISTGVYETEEEAVEYWNGRDE